ncbi:MAG TPA: hypothetical protein PLX89_08660 [Verrucomicrobiota bacterium]|nr:hypothetical protein [Verrucomicrobiales bacterium]HRI13063.1 hypothetical protein [Verrucomicrobiota bacterium]
MRASLTKTVVLLVVLVFSIQAWKREYQRDRPRRQSNESSSGPVQITKITEPPKGPPLAIIAQPTLSRWTLPSSAFLWATVQGSTNTLGRWEVWNDKTSSWSPAAPGLHPKFTDGVGYFQVPFSSSQAYRLVVADGDQIIASSVAALESRDDVPVPDGLPKIVVGQTNGEYFAGDSVTLTWMFNQLPTTQAVLERWTQDSGNDNQVLGETSVADSVQFKYRLASIAPEQAGYYRLILTNSVGRLYSRTVTVKVKQRPTKAPESVPTPAPSRPLYLKQPTYSVVEGGEVTLGVANPNHAEVYEWEWQATGSDVWKTLYRTQDSEIKLFDVHPLHGGRVRVRARGSTTAESVSEPAVLEVKSLPRALVISTPAGRIARQNEGSELMPEVVQMTREQFRQQLPGITIAPDERKPPGTRAALLTLTAQKAQWSAQLSKGWIRVIENGQVRKKAQPRLEAIASFEGTTWNGNPITGQTPSITNQVSERDRVNVYLTQYREDAWENEALGQSKKACGPLQSAIAGRLSAAIVQSILPSLRAEIDRPAEPKSPLPNVRQ